MNLINLTFLGQEFTLPYDIISYMDCQQFFSTLRQDLLSFMLGKFGNCEKWPNLDLATNKFRGTADQCVKRLCELGVYDKTVEDFIENNEGFDLYNKAVKEVLIKQSEILLAQMKNFEADLVAADQAAASKITGMGFTVYSSSIIDLGVFAAMEHNTLKKQAAAADAQYNAMVEEARRRGQSSSDKQTAKLNAEYWLPKMNEAVTVFVASLFSQFIDYLIAANKFDAATRDYLDIKRAELIIKNVDSAADKKQLTREAFIKCPFCTDVYTAVVTMGFFTHDECHTARIFRMLDNIEADLHAAVDRISMDSSIPENAVVTQLIPYANASAIIHDSSVSTTIDQYLSRRRKRNLLKLQRLQKIDGQSNEFDYLMRKAFSENMDDIFKILQNGTNTNEVLTSYLSMYIDRVTLHNDTSCYYSSHKQETLEILVEKAHAYIQEATTRYNAYKERADAFTKLNAETDRQIAALSDERQKLGFFGFSRRKAIDSEIVSLQDRVTQSEQAMHQAQKYWEKMYKNAIVQNERTNDKMTSIRCINCGSLITSNHSQCPNCGWNLTE